MPVQKMVKRLHRIQANTSPGWRGEDRPPVFPFAAERVLHHRIARPPQLRRRVGVIVHPLVRRPIIPSPAPPRVWDAASRVSLAFEDSEA